MGTISLPPNGTTLQTVPFSIAYWYDGKYPPQLCGSGPLRGGLGYQLSAIPATGSTDKVVSVSEKTAGYFAKVAKGEFIPYTNYAVSSSKWNHSTMTTDPSCWLDIYLNRWVNAQASGPPSVVRSLQATSAPVVATPNLDVLLQRAWADARSGASQILVDLAERKETYNLLRKVHSRYWDRAQRIETLAHKRLKGMRVKDISRYVGNAQSKALNLLGETWMEYRYGWTPLVYSSKDLAKAVLELNAGNPDGVNYILRESSAKEVVTGTDGGSAGLTVGWSFANNYGSYCQTISCSNTQKKTARAKVAYTCKLQALKAFDTNLLTLGWELVPFSFVADWLWNIPDILRAHWPVSNIDMSTACVSVKTEDTLTFRYGKPNASQPALLTYGQIDHVTESYVRTKRSDVPLVLSYQPHITWKRCLDATVLLRGLTGRMVSKLTRSIASKLGKIEI